VRRLGGGGLIVLIGTSLLSAHRAGREGRGLGRISAGAMLYYLDDAIGMLTPEEDEPSRS
jgi:hypothetical protein